MKRIKYLCYYAQSDDTQKRNAVLAATNKIDYICAALNKSGYYTEIISASTTKDKKHSYKGFYKKVDDQRFLRMFFTFPWGNGIQKLLSLISMKLFLFIELMKVKKNEKIIVYHSLGYMGVVKFVHCIRRFHLILEVEEIYSDVIGDTTLRTKEIGFLQSADSYIFPTELLNQLINKKSKPYVLIHGTYQVEPDRKCRIDKIGLQIDKVKKIHCVYAGTFDPRKGGAIAAAAAAEFLPNSYHIHILGFGNDKDTRKMKEFVDELANKSGSCVTFDGCLSGEEYIRFIQSCDIGLSTQNPDAKFNATSFPSKILSYLSNGLRVVSVRIPAIETSAIGEYMYYYDEQTPEEIAQAILRVDMKQSYDSRKLIADLACRFETEIACLLQ